MSIAEERQEINEMEAGMEKNTGAQQEEALQSGGRNDGYRQYP